MNRIFLGISLFFCFSLTIISCSRDKDSKQEEKPVFRIGIWACNQYGMAKPAVKKYLQSSPDLMLYIGDNVYVDQADEASNSLAILNFIKSRNLAENPDTLSELQVEAILENWVWNTEEGQSLKFFDFNNDGKIQSSENPLSNEKRYFNAYLDLWSYEYLENGNQWKFADLFADIPYQAIWDDHDFGKNNGQGGLLEGAMVSSAGNTREVGWMNGKKMGRNNFVKFWKLENELPSTNGIYNSKIWPLNNGINLQVILLDNRWYQNGVDSVLLGEEQWQWLLSELDKPADIRLIVSGTHILTDDAKMESWEYYSKERQRLFEAIERRNLNQVYFLSGDKHFAAVSALKAGTQKINGKATNLFSHNDYYEFHFAGINETERWHTTTYFDTLAGTTDPIAWGNRVGRSRKSKESVKGDKFALIDITQDSIIFKVMALQQKVAHSNNDYIADDSLLVKYAVPLGKTLN